MIITGVSLAKMPLIEVFKDIKMYQFTFLKMLVIPMIAAFAIRLFHLDPVLSGIMVLMFGMPNGSMAVMMAIDYGLDSSICSRGIVLDNTVIDHNVADCGIFIKIKNSKIYQQCFNIHRHNIPIYCGKNYKIKTILWITSKIYQKQQEKILTHPARII